MTNALNAGGKSPPKPTSEQEAEAEDEFLSPPEDVELWGTSLAHRIEQFAGYAAQYSIEDRRTMTRVPGLVYGALFGFTAGRSLKYHPRISDITEDVERTALYLADGGRVARYRLLVVDKCKKGGTFKAKAGGISARFTRNGHARCKRLSRQAVANKFPDLLRLAKAGKDSQVPDHGFIFKPRRRGGRPLSVLKTRSSTATERSRKRRGQRILGPPRKAGRKAERL